MKTSTLHTACKHNNLRCNEGSGFYIRIPVNVQLATGDNRLLRRDRSGQVRSGQVRSGQSDRGVNRCKRLAITSFEKCL